MKKTAAVLSFVLAMGSIATFATPAMAAAPTVTAIAGPTNQPVGSVAGGYDVVIDGEDFCDVSNNDVVTAANIGNVALTNLSVSCNVNGTEDELRASVSAQALANREIGRKLVVVETSAGTNSNQVYFGFIPEVDESYSTSQLVELGDLFSRSQRQPIIRSRTAPYTVTGTDFLTGQPYTYITNYDYLQGLDCVNPSSSSMTERCGAYTHEADLGQAFHPGAIDPVVLDGGLETVFQVQNANDAQNERSNVLTSNGTVPFNTWLDGRTVTELYSDLDCEPTNPGRGGLNPENFFDSGDGDGAKYTFCAGFGPDIYSEPFVASAGQSLAFEWAAMGVSDDYAVYAYLVEVDPNTGAIPVTATAANHELVMFNSGHRSGPSDWQTSTVDVTDGGTYRFRFINGTYDGTGGYALGSLFYLNSFFLAGDTNEITFGEFDDVVYDPASPVIAVTASSVAGGQPTVITLTPLICTVATSSPSLPQYNVTIVSSPGTCILQAGQGQTGSYAPAASVLTAFEVYTTAQAPAAPTLLSANGLSQTSLAVDFQAGPSGGQSITGYEYSLDGGAWVAISPTPTNSFTIQGLASGTSYDVQIRAINATGPGSVSNTVVGTTLGSSAPAGGNRVIEPYNGPEITAIVPKIVKTAGGETVTVVGRRLGAAVDLTIGGIKVTMITPTETGFQFVMPAGTAGLKDMVYRYDGGASFTVLGALEAVAPVIVKPETGDSTENAAPKPWSAVGVANMFAPGSSVVNSRVRAQVVAMLRQYGSIATKVECSGFTMGPTVLRVDAALSRARATAVCSLIKQLRPRLTVVRAVGKQETKLGGAVRRVEVLFTRG